MNDKFASGFAQDLESMIALKRALGYFPKTLTWKGPKVLTAIALKYIPASRSLPRPLC